MASGRVSLVLFAAALLILGASALEVTLSSERNPQDIHVDLIDSANTTIRAAVYKFSDDKILEAILDALDRGVRVELVVDLVENEDKDSHANAAAKEGAHVRFYSTSKYEKLHAKFSIFDDEIAVSYVEQTYIYVKLTIIP